jgi:transcriptional regulator GlxA family with amidase domain
MPNTPHPLVAVLAFDQISPFHLSVPCAVFGEKHPGAPRFDLRVFTFETTPLRTSAGFCIGDVYDLSVLALADFIVIPSWRDPNETPPKALLDALVNAAARGAHLIGLCLGSYVLAEAGLLDGLSATTHWEAANDFAQRYPRIQLEADKIFINHGRIYTSAGTAAGLDCCLHVLRSLYGAKVSNAVARRLVVPPQRQGGQSQFIQQPLPSSASDTRLSALIDWVRQNIAQPYTLDSLASKALMSRRTFTRHFQQLHGLSVGQWLVNERLAVTLRLLEESDLSIEQITEQSGFGSSAALRQHFRQQFGLSPQAWRLNFRGDAA